MAWPQVFVSYAHDSQPHELSVRRLCELLAESGIDVRVDCWAVGERRDWQVWMTTQILEADFVIIIASPACLRVGDGEVTPAAHLGLRSEMRTLRELYHRDPDTWTKKMLPVVLPGRSVDEIPLFLQPYTADHFIVPSITPAGAKDLLRVITGPPCRCCAP
jgi:SEFIR domain-containing protein